MVERRDRAQQKTQMNHYSINFHFGRTLDVSSQNHAKPHNATQGVTTRVGILRRGISPPDQTFTLVTGVQIPLGTPHSSCTHFYVPTNIRCVLKGILLMKKYATNTRYVPPAYLFQISRPGQFSIGVGIILRLTTFHFLTKT